MTALLLFLPPVAGCRDISTNPSPLSGAIEPRSGGQYASAPWRSMSDEELAAAVDSAGGRVFIGFKEPHMARGVRRDGTVLVGTETVEGAKAALRALGLEFSFESRYMPAVVTRMSGEQVSLLRSLPFVDNIEPILPPHRVEPTFGLRPAPNPAALAFQPLSTPWNVSRIGAPAAWGTTTGGGARVLAIESGIAEQHEALSWHAYHQCP